MKFKLILFAAVLAVLFLPVFFTNATTIEELQAQLSQLQQQISQIQQQQAMGLQNKGVVPQSTTTSVALVLPDSSWCYTFATDLRYGMSGFSTEISALQIALQKQGFTVLSAELASSNFGQSTQTAVIAFQEKYASEILTPIGLTKGTGNVASLTRAKLNNLYGCNKSAVPSVSTKDACIEDWICTAWGSCLAGNYRTRVCTDNNACGTTIDKPNETEYCDCGWSGCDTCTPAWSCGDWSACVGGQQTRTCQDTSCSNPATTETQSCVMGPTANIKANNSDGPTGVLINKPVTLSWTSTNANSCTASGGWSGDKAVSGSETIPSVSTTAIFTITCTGSAGTATDSVTVNVFESGSPTLEFTANDIAGGPVTVSSSNDQFPAPFKLKWATKNAASCQIQSAQILTLCRTAVVDSTGVFRPSARDYCGTPEWSGSTATSGTLMIQPSVKTYPGIPVPDGTLVIKTYKMNCNGIQGYDSKEVIVYIPVAGGLTIPPSIKILSPVPAIAIGAGENWELGKTYNIRWQTTYSDSVKIELIQYINNGQVQVQKYDITQRAQQIPASPDVYSWTVPTNLPVTTTVSLGLGGMGVEIFRTDNSYKILITGYKRNASGTNHISEKGESFFNIVPVTPGTPQVPNGVTWPNGGETLAQGTTYNIRWTGIDSNRVQISTTDYEIGGYVPGSGTSIFRNFKADIANVPGSPGSFAWTVPAGLLPGSKFKITVNSVSTPTIRDESDGYFTIASTASVTCTDSDKNATGLDPDLIAPDYSRYYVKGTTSGMYTEGFDLFSQKLGDIANGTVKTLADTCSGNMLKEYTCSSKAYIWVENFECANGCSNGACNTTAQPTLPPEPGPEPGQHNLLSHYKFDTDASDISGNGYNGIVKNGAVLTTGKINKAYQFDGVNDYIAINGPNSNAGLALGNEITLSAWIKTDSTALGGIIKRGDNSVATLGQEYALYIKDGNIYLIFTDGVKYTRLNGGKVNDNQWHLVTGVLKTDNTMEIYVDGVKKVTGTKTSGKYNSYSLQAIGTFKLNGYFFKGFIDDARIYNYALTADEITALYQQVVPVSPPPPTSGITILSPSAGDKWQQGSTVTIKWQVGGIFQSAPVNYIELRNTISTSYDKYCYSPMSANINVTPVTYIFASLYTTSTSNCAPGDTLLNPSVHKVCQGRRYIQYPGSSTSTWYNSIYYLNKNEPCSFGSDTEVNINPTTINGIEASYIASGFYAQKCANDASSYCYNYKVPYGAGDKWKLFIKIADWEAETGYFSMTPRDSITIISPTAGVALTPRSDVTIKWKVSTPAGTTPPDKNFKISLIDYIPNSNTSSGITEYPIIADFTPTKCANDASSYCYLWKVPVVKISSKYKIAISYDFHPSYPDAIKDSKETGYFTINTDYATYYLPSCFDSDSGDKPEQSGAVSGYFPYYTTNADDGFYYSADECAIPYMGISTFLTERYCDGNTSRQRTLQCTGGVCEGNACVKKELPITILSPIAGTTLTPRSDVTIKWKPTTVGAKFDIKLIDDAPGGWTPNGSKEYQIIGNFTPVKCVGDATSYCYSWKVPEIKNGDKYKIYIYSDGFWKESSYFSIYSDMYSTICFDSDGGEKPLQEGAVSGYGGSSCMGNSCQQPFYYYSDRCVEAGGEAVVFENYCSPITYNVVNQKIVPCSSGMCANSGACK